MSNPPQSYVICRNGSHLSPDAGERTRP